MKNNLMKLIMNLIGLESDHSSSGGLFMIESRGVGCFTIEFVYV